MPKNVQNTKNNKKKFYIKVFQNKLANEMST